MELSWNWSIKMYFLKNNFDILISDLNSKTVSKNKPKKPFKIIFYMKLLISYIL